MAKGKASAMVRRRWKRKVDNKMHGFADIDEDKKIIRVNKRRSKEEGEGEVLDSIVHEEVHRKHPKMHEKNVEKHTKEDIKKMNKREKQKNYGRYK